MQYLEDPASAFDGQAKPLIFVEACLCVLKLPTRSWRAGAPRLEPESKKSHSYSGGKQEKSLSSIGNHSFA